MLKLLLLVTFTTTIVSSSFAAPPSPGRIVGGHDVNITKHPHQISLRRKNCPQCPYKHICGGSIYKENIIITAAHCVYEDKPENFVILAGTTLNNGTDGVTIPLKQIVVKDDYAPLSYDNDVALLFLEQPLPLNDVTIRPIPLASQVPQAGEIATVTGWGRTKAGGKGTLILQEVELPIVDHKACRKAYTAVDTAMTIMDSMICAGLIGVGGKDSCQGDSGGPLVVNGELAGIVSWGMRCAEPQFPGVYSNVFHYRNWIEKMNN